MRTKIVVGNWKMNKTVEEGVELSTAILEQIGDGIAACDVGVAPPFTALEGVKRAIGRSGIRLVAQNCHHEDDGAYTGEVSVRMLDSLGCTYVILGHSERRQLFGETSAVVNLKVKKTLDAGLQAIMCVGETLDERERSVTEEVVTGQVREGLDGVDDLENVVIAYEPVWAIGTGKTATPEQAQEVHASIRRTVRGIYGETTADRLRIQYGGSVKPSNAAELFSMPDIDGGLIGGASLKAEDFAAIVRAAGR